MTDALLVMFWMLLMFVVLGFLTRNRNKNSSDKQ